MGEGRWQARPCTCDPGPEGQHARWCGLGQPLGEQAEELRERFTTALREGKVKLIAGEGATELHIPERVPVTLDWGDQIGEATLRVDEDGVHFTCYLTPSGRVREALEQADSVSFGVPEDKLTPLGREVLGLQEDLPSPENGWSVPPEKQ